jgi:protein-disulfide isomerase
MWSRHVRLGALTLATHLALTSTAVAASAQDLFRLNGKAYQLKDLSLAEQQALYDILSDEHQRLQVLAKQAALNIYFGEEAKKSGKTRSEAEASVLAVSDPTDKQVSDWFEQNKARIPPGYTVDKVAGEIRALLRDQALRDKREALLTKLQGEGKFALLLSEPEAPLVSIDTKNAPVRGVASAKVTLVEFADYQCPHCKAAAPILDDLVKRHAGKVKFVFMDFPIKGEYSQLAAEAAFCAGEQGKYWEFHDLAFEKQQELANKDTVVNMAKTLKLDGSKFSACIAGGAAKAYVSRVKAEGERLGITGTPSLFINGRRIKGHDAAELDKAIAKAL